MSKCAPCCSAHVSHILRLAGLSHVHQSKVRALSAHWKAEDTGLMRIFREIRLHDEVVSDMERSTVNLPPGHYRMDRA